MLYTISVNIKTTNRTIKIIANLIDSAIIKKVDKNRDKRDLLKADDLVWSRASIALIACYKIYVRDFLICSVRDIKTLRR